MSGLLLVVFGCTAGADGLRHYAECPKMTVRAKAARILGGELSPLAVLGIFPPSERLAATAFTTYQTLRSGWAHDGGGGPWTEAGRMRRIELVFAAAAREHGHVLVPVHHERLLLPLAAPVLIASGP